MSIAFLILQLAEQPGGDFAVTAAFHGREGGAGFPAAIAAIADLDGDGIPELAMGAPASSHVSRAGGAAFVFSGRSGRLIFEWYGETQSASFGTSIDRAGDINGDGYDDILVGAPYAWVNGYFDGSVYVFSGRDGHRLQRVDGRSRGHGRIGQAVSTLGDVNNDGCADYLISDPEWAANAGAIGAVWIVSGKDGAILQALNSQGDIYIGSVLRGIDDIDGDGLPDVLTATGSDVILYSSGTGLVIRRHPPMLSNDHFGRALCDAGDVDGDGVTEYAVGAPGNNANGNVYLFSGATGSLLRSWEGPLFDGGFGEVIVGTGDIDGDGYPELLIGAPDDPGAWNFFAGAAYLYSTFDGRMLGVFQGQTAQDVHVGRSLAASRNAMPDAPLSFSIGSSSSTHGLIANGVVRSYALDSFLELRPGALSAAAGGPVGLDLDFPPSEAGRAYSILVSSGAGRFRVGEVLIPLSRTALLARSAFAPPGGFHNQHGVLDFYGDARADFRLAPGAAGPWIGRTLKFCALTHDPAGGVGLHSAAMPLTVGP